MEPVIQSHENEEVEEDDLEGGPFKKGNIIKLWGNKESMNMNSMILTNILSSPYYKNHLADLTTYHEVIDEIYYRVQHLEPWEKGSRKVGGQTDSPYIRALGFLYIRYSVPPEEFWAWFSPYLDDEEECDAKAGGGCSMTLGEMAERMLTKLDWFSTLFPRIPVPIQKRIDTRMREYREAKRKNEADERLISVMMGAERTVADDDGGHDDQGGGGHDDNKEQEARARSRSKDGGRHGSRRRRRSKSRSPSPRTTDERHRSRKRHHKKHHRREDRDRRHS